MFTATASATGSATASATVSTRASATASASGSTEEEAIQIATETAIATANTYALRVAQVSLDGGNKPNDPAVDTAKYMLLACIDFRFIDNINYFGRLIERDDTYDMFILAGSSLGYNGITGFTGWNTIFEQHVDLAIQLHDIQVITILDHMECGAYKLQYGPDAMKDEERLHVENLIQCAQTLKALYPNLEIETFLINVEGTVITKIDNGTQTPSLLTSSWSSVNPIQCKCCFTKFASPQGENTNS